MAVKLKRVNVDGMLRCITAKQFFEWEAYDALEPFTEEREDYRNAAIIQMIHNTQVKKEHQKTLGEFVVFKKDADEIPKRRKQTWQEQKQIAYSIVMAFNAQALDKT
jgi:hypothetical protein